MAEAKPVKKESLFVIDFIKNCEMSHNIMHNIDAEDIIIIDPKTGTWPKIFAKTIEVSIDR